MITALDLVEHLLDPVAAIRRCGELLVPGGHLFLYTPNHSSVIVRTASLLYTISGGLVPELVYTIQRGFAAGYPTFVRGHHAGAREQRLGIDRWRAQSVPYALTYEHEYPLVPNRSI